MRVYHCRYRPDTGVYVLHDACCRFAPRWGRVEAATTLEAAYLLSERWPAAEVVRFRACQLCLRRDASLSVAVRRTCESLAGAGTGDARQLPSKRHADRHPAA